jgi:hypothetical protein
MKGILHSPAARIPAKDTSGKFPAKSKTELVIREGFTPRN